MQDARCKEGMSLIVEMQWGLFVLCDNIHESPLAKNEELYLTNKRKEHWDFKKLINMWRNIEISAQGPTDMREIHSDTHYRRSQKMNK